MLYANHSYGINPYVPRYVLALLTLMQKPFPFLQTVASSKQNKTKQQQQQQQQQQQKVGDRGILNYPFE